MCLGCFYIYDIGPWKWDFEMDVIVCLISDVSLGSGFECTWWYTVFNERTGSASDAVAFLYGRCVWSRCLCLFQLGLNKEVTRTGLFLGRLYAIKGRSEKASLHLFEDWSMGRCFVMILLRYGEAGLWVTTNGMPWLRFCCERLGCKAWSRVTHCALVISCRTCDCL